MISESAGIRASSSSGYARQWATGEAASEIPVIAF
jgi:hypothetical protein